MSRRGWWLFAAMCVIWGLPYLLIKIAVAELTPASVVFLRTGLAAALILPIAAARGLLRPVLPRWRPLLLFTAAELTLPWYLLADAEQHISSSLAGLLVAAVPLAAALLGWGLRTEERLGPRRVAGLLVGLAGVAALLGLDTGATSTRALVEMGLVVLGYALAPIVLYRWLNDVPSLGVIAASLTITALVYAPFGIAQLPTSNPGTQVIVAVLVLSLVCTALAFLLFFALVAEAGPLRALVITYVNPAVAVALGVTLLDEPLTLGTAVGFVLILLGSVLATRRSPAVAVPPPRDGEGAAPARGARVEQLASDA